MSNITTFVSMTSLDLLNMVNESRAENDESLIRNRVFVARIEDELEGELSGAKFLRGANNVDQKYYDLTLDQCMLVGMRESKAVRRKVLAKLHELEQVRQPMPSNVTALEHARFLLDIAPELSQASKITVLANAQELDLGRRLIELPNIGEKLINATEVGKIVGISSSMVGRIANQNGLKTDEYGMTVLDYTKQGKQVPNFLYNQTGVERIRELYEARQSA